MSKKVKVYGDSYKATSCDWFPLVKAFASIDALELHDFLHSRTLSLVRFKGGGYGITKQGNFMTRHDSYARLIFRGNLTMVKTYAYRHLE